MNANELADELYDLDVQASQQSLNDWGEQAATMLRQQQAEIAELKHMNKNWQISEGMALAEIEEWKRKYKDMHNLATQAMSRVHELEKKLDTRTRELIGASFYEHDYKTMMANNEPVAWIEPDVIPLTHIIKAVVRREQDEQYSIPLYTHPVKEQDGCGNCHACLVGVTEHGLPLTFQRMILCPDCGNKRCPKASNHRHQCTESNEPNQRGSIYTHLVKELTEEEIEFIFFDLPSGHSIQEFARAILRKAQEK